MAEEKPTTQEPTQEVKSPDQDLFDQIMSTTGEQPQPTPEQPEESTQEPTGVEEPESTTEESAEEQTTENPLLELDGEDAENKVQELMEAEDLTKQEKEFLEQNGYEVEIQEQTETDQTPEEAEQTPEETEEKELPAYANEIQELMPETEFNSKEDYEKAVVDFIKQEQESNKMLLQTFEANPDLKSVITDMINNGKGFLEALHKNIDIDSLNVEPGDDDYEKVVRAKLQREQEAEKQAERAKMFQENQKKSVQEADSFLKEMKMEPKKRTEFFDKIDSIINDFNQGRMTKQTLEMFYKGLEYDQAVTAAKKTGEVAGRNARIKITKRKMKGDGNTKVKSSASSTIRSQPVKDSNDPLGDLLEATGLSN